jgi:hypothetical protein
VLHYNGQLMVRVAGRSYKSLVDGPGPLLIRGYEIEPLFKCYQTTSAFSPTIAQDNWFLAAPSQFAEGPPLATTGLGKIGSPRFQVSTIAS